MTSPLHSLSDSNPRYGVIRHIGNLYGLLTGWMLHIPPSLIAFLARFSLAAIFWKSGQTKVEGFAIDLFSTDWTIGWPHLSDSAVPLFQSEYHLPLLPPELAATMAATAEHFFPILLLFGFATRLSALGLFCMTAVIEIFVYPDAYPTHGIWATGLLFIMLYGPGKLSIDHLLKRRLA